jgi:hypothetical protein
MVAVSVIAGLLIAVVAISISLVVYLVIRFVVLMRSGEEMVGANSWSDRSGEARRTRRPSRRSQNGSVEASRFPGPARTAAP